jgi:hypothetical protein
VFRLLLPIQCREAVFKSLLSIHHPGVRSTRPLITARFCCPQMAKAITLMARACLFCQQVKVQKHIHLQPAEILVPHCFAHIHLDLVGQLLPFCGHTYLFTVINRTSRWPEAIPLPSITAADCARALLAGWVSRFGVPATSTSDRGAQFTSGLWAALCSLLNIKHSPSTAFHPQSNGLVELFHRRLKDTLQSRAAAADWHDHLHWVMLGIRASFREDSKFSTTEAVFGSQLVLPGQLGDTAESPSPSFLEDLQTAMAGRPPLPTRHNLAPAPSTLPEELLLARFVLVRRDGAQPSLSPVYDGPYQVLEPSTQFFLLQIGERTDKISTLRLKQARTPADTEPAQPPRRGHPFAQVLPVCGAPPVRAAPPSLRGAAATGDLQTANDIATINSIHIIIRSAPSQRLAADTTQPLSLLPQSLGGGPVVAYPLFPVFPPTCHVTLPDVAHMCTYVYTRLPSLKYTEVAWQRVYISPTK